MLKRGAIRWALLLSAILAVVWSPLLLAQVVDPQADVGAAATDLVTYGVATLSGFLTSFLVGGLKKYTAVFDAKILGAKVYKAIQPVIVLVGSYGFTWLWAKLGIGLEIPTSDLFAAAPFGTTLTVTLRELLRRWKEREPAPA